MIQKNLGNDRMTSNRISRSASFSEEIQMWEFNREDCEKIAEAFHVSDIKIQNLRDKDLHLKCFKKVLRACESNQWEEINAVRELVVGIRDLKGRTIYEVLTESKDAPPNFYINPPENLIFQGGGPKGLAYIGVLEVLEEKNLMEKVRRVAGTSAGAITATLIAFGYSAEDVRTLMTQQPLTQFLDFPSTKGGICKGKAFLTWINALIEKKTGIKNCTFGELHSAIKEEGPFKHLHIFATKVGSNKEIFQFSSEDERWYKLVIADAVRASMSLPVVFQPHTLRFKNPVTQTCYDDGPSFMDGGIIGNLINLPIEAFDKKRYVKKVISKIEGECPVTNKGTLAFAIYTPGSEIPKKDTRVTCMATAFGEFRDARGKAVRILKKSRTYDQYRTVKISNTQVGTFLGFFESEEKKEELIESGRAATEMFFQEQEERAKRLKITESTDPIDLQAEVKKNIYLVYKNNRSNQSIIGVEIIGDYISFHTDYLCSFSPVSNLNPYKDQFSFTRLAELDNRFQIFIHLLNGEKDEADIIFERYQLFFQKCFSWGIFRRLIIERNNPAYLDFFISKGFEFTTSTFQPLWYAYKRGAFKSFEALLQDPSVDLQATEKKTNKTLLYYFAKEGQVRLAELFCAEFNRRHPESFKALLEQKVNSSVGIKKTAFIIALEKEQYDMASFLVEQGVDYHQYHDALEKEKQPYYCNKWKTRQFLCSVLSGDIKRDLSANEKLKALDFCLTYEEYGKEETCGRRYGTVKTSPDLYTDRDGYEYASKLIRNKIICSPIEDTGTPRENGFLLTVLEFGFFRKKDLVKLLLEGENKDDVNQVNEQGVTPLILTAMRKYDDLLAYLVTIQGIDVNHQDDKGNTALHYSVYNNKRESVKKLLNHEAINPDLQNNLDQTPLHLTHDNYLIRLLTDAKADLSLRDGKGKNPRELHQALSKSDFTFTATRDMAKMYVDLFKDGDLFTGTVFALTTPILAPIFFAIGTTTDTIAAIKHSLSNRNCACNSCKQKREDDIRRRL